MSKRQWARANTQKCEGAGASPIYVKEKIIRRNINAIDGKKDLQYAIEQVLPKLQHLAHGIRSQTLSNDEKISTPCLSLICPKVEIEASYYASFSNIEDQIVDGDYIPQPLAVDHFKAVIDSC